MPGATRRELLESAAASALILAGCHRAPDEPGSVPAADASLDATAAAPPDAAAPDAEAADAGAQPDTGAPDAGFDATALEHLAESAAFTFGVASGDAVDGRVVLWTRRTATGTPPALAAIVLDDHGREVSRWPATVADGGFVHVDVSGLTAGARYRYAFVELGAGWPVARTNIGRFRVALDPDALETVLFGATSCTDNSKPFTTLARAAEVNLDAFLLLGDTAYCEDCQTLQEYRGYWDLHLIKPEHIALRASTSVMATWDDHEVANDWDPERIDPARVTAARQAYFENLPLRRLDGTPDRIWRRARWGKTVEVFILDSRSDRLPSTRNTPGAIYLSREQMDWLKTGLASSDAVFKVIMSSVPVSDMPTLWDFYRRDRWEGYDAQRLEILEHIDNTPISGVLWVAGDFHLASVGRVASSGPGATQTELLVGPGAQTSSPLWNTLRPPQFDWSSGDNNYTQLRFDPFARTVSIIYVGASGQALFSRTLSV